MRRAVAVPFAPPLAEPKQPSPQAARPRAAVGGMAPYPQRAALAALPWGTLLLLEASFSVCLPPLPDRVHSDRRVSCASARKPNAARSFPKQTRAQPQETRCFSLFATHFHELATLEDVVPGVRNRHATAVVDAASGRLTFLYALADGATDQSYGAHVAELAGFPARVVTAARRKALGLGVRRGQNPRTWRWL